MKFNRLFKKSSAPKVIGRHLRVSLPEFGLQNIRAKVDTGAYSGALHAENVTPVTLPDGTKVLRFNALHGKTVEVTDFHIRRIVSSSGHMTRRYAVQTSIEIDGQQMPIRVTLTDRSTMRRPMLIGRSFLREHGYLVDVTKFNK
jgi:hypothetical protein